MSNRSDHFDGKRYYNAHIPKRSFWWLIYWILTRRPTPWPHQVDVQPQKIPRPRVGGDECIVTFVNHSSVLIQLEGLNILTDPIWSERASPFKGMGPKRVGDPGIKFEDLPPIDVVLISHNHYDHMDIPTLKRLYKFYQPAFYVPQGNRLYLEAKGIKGIKEIDWWDFVDLSETYRLSCVPAQHFSSRGIFDTNRMLWGGFVIKGAKLMIYFAGDTGYHSFFKEIYQKYGAPTVSLLPIGAFKPRWFMESIHLSPDEAVQAHLDLHSKQSIAIHFGTFPLGDEGIDVPAEELEKALLQNSLSTDDFWILKPGEARYIFT